MSDYEELRGQCLSAAAPLANHAYSAFDRYRQDGVTNAWPLIEAELRKRDERISQFENNPSRSPKFPPDEIAPVLWAEYLESREEHLLANADADDLRNVVQLAADQLEQSRQREAEARELLRRVSNGWIDTTFRLGRELLLDIDNFLESQKGGGRPAPGTSSSGLPVTGEAEVSPRWETFIDGDQAL